MLYSKYILAGLLLQAADGQKTGKVHMKTLRLQPGGQIVPVSDYEDSQDSSVMEITEDSSRECVHYLLHDVASAKSEDEHNDWDGKGNSDCGNNQALVSAYSTHSNHAEDRKWKFSCKPLKGVGASLENCQWTEYTDLDASWSNVPNTNELQVIAGVKSRHDDQYEDRQYAFKYCHVNGVKLVKSWWDSEWRNGWDEDMTLQEGENTFIRRWQSQHSNHAEDRKFKFLHTQFCLNPTNCNVSAWDSWGACDKPCAGGQQTRTRKVTAAAKNGGQCVPLSQTKACNTHACPVDCQMNAWSLWGNCDKTCGGGTTSRTQTLKTKNQHGGTECPAEDKWKEEKVCNEDPCPTTTTTTTTKPWWLSGRHGRVIRGAADRVLHAGLGSLLPMHLFIHSLQA